MKRNKARSSTSTEPIRLLRSYCLINMAALRFKRWMMEEQTNQKVNEETCLQSADRGSRCARALPGSLTQLLSHVHDRSSSPATVAVIRSDRMTGLCGEVNYSHSLAVRTEFLALGSNQHPESLTQTDRTLLRSPIHRIVGTGRVINHNSFTMARRTQNPFRGIRRRP